MAELIVSQNNQTRFRVVIDKSVFKIGRASENDLILPDIEISRRHAEIQLKEDGFTLFNHGTSGTLLDNQEIAQATLRESQMIRIGSWSLEFRNQNNQINSDEAQTRITKSENTNVTQVLKLNPDEETFTVKNPQLVVYGNQTKTYPIEGRILIIGGKADCDVVLEDDYVSSRHCELFFKDNEIILKDLNSTNGTLVNGAKIDKVSLNKNSEILIGKTKLNLRWVEEVESIKPILVDEFCGLVGKSDVMRKLYKKIERVAQSPLSVLIQGESGCGKELVARAIHELSLLKTKPYVILNCGAISANLIESELFGHEKGAFTGAQNRRMGAFEQAQGGTLFLDELGELPLELQPKLLRVLENRTVRRVGGNEDIPVNVRVIAATHRNLNEMVNDGQFREDLFFRLYVLPLRIPALRERKGDISLLARHFVKQSATLAPPSVSEAALEKLEKHLWPGNVRELKNVILRTLVFCENDCIESKDVEIMEHVSLNANDMDLENMEKRKIFDAINQADGNKTKAAELLGIARSTLFKKIKEYEVE